MRRETYTENNPALWDFVSPISPAVYGQLHAAYAVLIF